MPNAAKNVSAYLATGDLLVRRIRKPNAAIRLLTMLKMPQVWSRLAR